MTECPSRFQLRRLVASDLPAVRAKNVNQHLVECATCSRLASLSKEKADAYFENEEQHLELLRKRIEEADGVVVRPKVWTKTAVISAVGAFTVAAAAWMFLVASPGGTDVAVLEGQLPEHISFKSSVAFETVAKRGQAVFQVAPGAQLHEADQLRFFVTTESPGYVSIFSVDASGQLFPYYPQSDPRGEPAPMHIVQAGRTPLEGSVVLDDSVGDEYFVLVYSKEPFDRHRVHAKIKTILSKTGKVPPVIGDLKIEMLGINKK